MEYDFNFNFNCTDTLAATSVSWSTPNERHLLMALVGPLKPEDEGYRRGHRWYATISCRTWHIVDGVPHKSPLEEHTHEWCFTRDQAADKAVAHILRLTNPPEGV